ncbi:MAG: hypothetical protein LBT66_07595 [Methanobrevibacter sp.]|jgi:predicted nucleic acid-binding protein|nr:hypothetical protein [Candidatus Methanovirga meridionalis]
MSLFFDTNVLLGFIFKWDPWHSYATKVFKDNCIKYYSDTVSKEYNNKFREMIDKYNSLLSIIISELSSSEGFMSKEDLIKIANKNNIKHIDKKLKKSIIDNIWEIEGYGLDENMNNLIVSIKEIKYDLKHDSFSRKDKCESILIKHIRTLSYNKIQDKLKEKIHFPDWKIFLDAHDLSYRLEPDLEVVTSDAKPEDLEYIKNVTNINKITDLARRIFK